jgi:phytanoyl-CoA hydroxylase
VPVSLDPSQIEQYYQQGYYIVKGALTDADFEPIETAYTELIDGRAKDFKDRGLIKDLCEDEPFATRFARIAEQIDPEIEGIGRELTWGLDIMHAKLPPMFEFFFNPNLLSPIESIIGSEILLSPIQHIRPYVPVRGDKQAMQVPWHQDQGVTKEEADVSEILTVWIPYVDVDADSGCLEIIPNQKQLLEHQPEGGTMIKPHLMPDEKPVDCVMQRGDLLFMSAYTPHRGHVNRSNYVRWSMDLRFQKTGTPTGRPFHPEFILQSKSDPDSVQNNYDEWSSRWDEGMESSKGIRLHRV